MLNAARTKIAVQGLIIEHWEKSQLNRRAYEPAASTVAMDARF
jgi:hypothetical protein